MEYSLVIDDDLAVELCKFKNNETCNTKLVEKILHYYKPIPRFINDDFMKLYYDHYFLETFYSNPNKNRINANGALMDNIVRNTTYKVILCNDASKKDTFPYVYIGGDRIENNFTATFLSGEDRKKAKEHLKSLLENARCIFVYDLYLANNWTSFISFAQECFPRKQLSIFYPKEIDSSNNANPTIPKLTQKQCSQIVQNGKCPWKFSVDRNHQNFSDLHDRYLIIDNKIEIILTSGIDNLMDKSKDFTYIVRQHKK